mmetsp:Transcript_1385/g.3000  ORF Transcript_1385/g.3000 Transcript_1385/m.3000 type:complete len:227 (+) Transcript_1385:326-1006(+)
MSHTSTVATLSHIVCGKRIQPAIGKAAKYRRFAAMLLARTSKTTDAAVPRLLSTFWIVFQVSPMERCSISAAMGGVRKAPAWRHINVDESVRSMAMVPHTKGNTIGGGIHEGLVPSAISFRSLSGVGRWLFSTENRRDLTAISAKKEAVRAVGTKDGRDEGRRGIPRSRAARVTRMHAHCSAVASRYFAVAPISHSFLTTAFVCADGSLTAVEAALISLPVRRPAH